METKVCVSCRMAREISEYTRPNGRSYGAKCRRCRNEQVRQWRKTDEGKAGNAKYSTSASGRALRKIWRDKSPEKIKAQYRVSYAIKRGDLQRQPCLVCGSIQVHAHHEDYSKPLDVMWLCPKHHIDHHVGAMK